MARRGRNARRVRRDRNTDNSLFSDKQAREICETKQNLFYSVRFFLSPTSLGRTLQIWIFLENVNVDVNLQKSIYSSCALYKYLWSIYTSLRPTLYNTEKEMINQRVMCPTKVNSTKRSFAISSSRRGYCYPIMWVRSFVLVLTATMKASKQFQTEEKYLTTPRPRILRTNSSENTAAKK